MGPDVLFDRDTGGLKLHVIASDRSHGDLHPLHTDGATLDRRQVAVAHRRWSMLDQRHGRDVIGVDAESRWPVAGVGDVVVSRRCSPVPVGVWAADCAPVVLFGDAGSVVGVHAGWRGLAAGVIESGVDAAVVHGERVIGAVLGPAIHPCCYEFGAEHLERVAAGVGASPATIRATTTLGRLALDVPAAVLAALGARGITLDVIGGCTGCDTRWFSHRGRQDAGRHAVVAWAEPRAPSTPR